MMNDPRNPRADQLLRDLAESGESTPLLLEPIEPEPRDLWRVVSADGSTRIFQTRQASEGGRAASRAVRGLPTAAKTGAPGRSLKPPVPISVAAAGAALDDELSQQLNSLIDAWPTLSPGIRGAIMALVRASHNGSSQRPDGTRSR